MGLIVSTLALAAGPRRSHAQLVLVTPEDGGTPSAISHAELSYAHGSGAPVTWLSLRLARGPAAVVASLPADAKVDAGLDAWFFALEATASPSVLLPRSATDCGKSTSVAHVRWQRDDGTSATELALSSAEDVVAALEEQGLVPPGDLPVADRYVIWSWPESDAPLTTRTLRIVGGSAPLTLWPGSPVPLLISSVTSGPQALPGELSNSELSVMFVAGKPSSDYRARLQDWLEARREPLLETRLSGPLFDWSILADKVSVRPLVESYALGAKSELSNVDASDCSRQLLALRDTDAPDLSACGDAVDFGLALAATGREQPTLQRFVVSGAQGFAPSELRSGGEPSSPVLRARSIDDSACPGVDASPPIIFDPRGPNTGSGNGSLPPTTVVVEEMVVVEETTLTDGSCSCTPGRDPYYDDRDTMDCSSDTSGDYDSSEDACSGDSSSSSDDSGCGSDTSRSSSSDDDSCDGGTEDSGYDGDTCTGSAAPGAEGGQKLQAALAPARAPRPRRMKTSLWSLTLAAIALPIRRRKCGRRASG